MIASCVRAFTNSFPTAIGSGEGLVGDGIFLLVYGLGAGMCLELFLARMSLM